MGNSGKIAVVGDQDSFSAFKAAGADIFPFTNASKVKDTIKTLAADGYRIILISERVAQEIDRFLDRFKTQPYPVILPVPDGAEPTGYGMRKLNENIEKVTGAIKDDKK